MQNLARVRLLTNPQLGALKARVALAGGVLHAIVEASGSKEATPPTEGKRTLMAAPITIPAVRPISASALQPLAMRVWATAISYVVIYGVTFAYFAPPATHLAAQGFAGYDTATATFALLLMAALTVTFGAIAFAYSVGWRVESDVRNRRTSPQRANIEFAAFGTLLALATAGVYLMVMSTSGELSQSLVGAAALALVAPGLAAALFTRAVVDHVAAAKRELFTTTLSALVVIVLTNYLIVGSLPPLADLPQLFGLQ